MFSRIDLSQRAGTRLAAMCNRLIAAGLLLAMGSGAASAQTPAAVATYPRAAQDFTGIVAQTETSPRDDAVTLAAPERLSLDFPNSVHLVKLILRDHEHSWVDISFRYSPIHSEHFEWMLPALDAAQYYTAEWAILDEQDRLVRGSFSFSFGEEARTPSLIRAEQELALRLRNGEDEVTRFVTPPRTQIILDQEPRAFDPPFTLRLDGDGPPSNRSDEGL